jgi:hypothetical protein
MFTQNIIPESVPIRLMSPTLAQIKLRSKTPCDGLWIVMIPVIELMTQKRDRAVKLNQPIDLLKPCLWLTKAKTKSSGK